MKTASKSRMEMDSAINVLMNFFADNGKQLVYVNDNDESESFERSSELDHSELARYFI